MGRIAGIGLIIPGFTVNNFVMLFAKEIIRAAFSSADFTEFMARFLFLAGIPLVATI